MDLTGEVFRLFINRTDCYAVQQPRGGYIRKNEPLTPRVLEQHLHGKKTIGAYQLNPEDNTVKTEILDLDPEHLEDPRETAERIIKVCLKEKNGRPRIWKHSLLLEASRYPDPSYHIWIFFLLPFPAKAARWLGYRILELAGLNPSQIEVFPKQGELTKERPYGNLIKLPLGLHQTAKKWSCFLNPETFEPIDPKVLNYSSGISFTNRDTERILQLADKKKPIQVKLDIPRKFKSLPDSEEEKAVQFLTRYWKRGYRNQLELSFLGLCIKRGVSYDSAYRIVKEVCERTGDEETPHRLQLVKYHYENRLNLPLKGSSGLREIIRGMVKHGSIKKP